MLINKVLCTRSRLFYNTSALDPKRCLGFPFCPRYVRKNWTGYFAIGKSTYSALGTRHERAKAVQSFTSTNQRFVKRFVQALYRLRTFVPSAECRVSRFVQDEIKSRPCISKMYRLPINRRTNILICSAIHPLSIDRLKTMYLERRKKKLYYKPLLGRRLEASELFTWTYFLFFLIIPICALIAKASQHSLTDFITIATQPIALSAYSVTFSMAFLASLFNAFFGFILAWVLVRYNFTGKRLLDAAIDLPFAVPTSVAGLTLATVYSPNGWIGSFLQQFGIQVVYTRLGVATAMVFVSLPFVVRSLQPVLQEIDSQIEEAAWALGASPYTTFRRVLAPTLLPAFLTGITLGFSRAIGEYGSLVIVSANIPYKDLIASVLIFQNLEQYSLGQATVIATVVLFISFAILLGVSAIQSWNRNKLSSGQK